ncbi:hypothetical protein N2152v2_005379 [Parachlorella kessleri]
MISGLRTLACLAVLVCLATGEADIPTEDEVTAMMAAQYPNLVAKLQQKDAREHILASMGATSYQAEEPTTRPGEARMAAMSLEKPADQKQQPVDFPGFALPAEAAAIIRDAREKFEAMKAQLAAAANATQQAPAGAGNIN